MRVLVLAAWLAAMAPSANAQRTIALTITSPAEHTVVAPGATVEVTVQARRALDLQGVMVIGGNPIGMSDGLQKSLPARIRVTIPRRISSGRYPITALGSTVGGETVSSESVTIAVERETMPLSIQTNMPTIYFSEKGEQSPIQLVATFRDDTKVSVERSTLVRYVSSDRNVVIVEEGGWARAIGPGRATITITYTLRGESVRTTVPTELKEPVPAARPNVPPLQITAPKNGTVVAPGQSITVNVTSPSPGTFTYVRVNGYAPLDAFTVATALPAQFPVRVPTTTAAGRYLITAMAMTASGQGAESDPVAIEVDRPEMPVTLRSPMPDVPFEETGQRLSIAVEAVFSDATTMDVTRSSRVTYTSSAPSVATIDSEGIINSVGRGRATITATYRVGPAALRTVVSVTVAKSPWPE